MKYYNFRIDAHFPPEFSTKYTEIIENEKRKNGVEIQHYIEETAPPPEMVIQMVHFTASSLTILVILYEFYKEIKGKKGKVYISSEDGRFDLEAYNIDELKVKLGDPKIRRYFATLAYPNISKDILKMMGRTLSNRPIFFEDRQLSKNNTTLFSDYEEDSQWVMTSIQIDDTEINRLFEEGTPLYAYAEPHKMYVGAPAEKIIFTNLKISLKPREGSSELKEQLF